jgi:YVTN family beta-propeller protein
MRVRQNRRGLKNIDEGVSLKSLKLSIVRDDDYMVLGLREPRAKLVVLKHVLVHDHPLHVYVADQFTNTVSVISTAANMTPPPIPVGSVPFGVAVTPDGSKVYVTNFSSNTVSVISTATNTVIATIAVGSGPVGVAFTPDGSKVYVTNELSNNVSVIDTATNTVTPPPIGVGLFPAAFGIFIQPAAPTFAGTPGSPNCQGTSVAALAQKYGGLEAAADALGVPSAIGAFCNG